MNKYVIFSLFACLCPLFFPWQVTLLVTLFASWFFPWTAIIVGSIEDMLYAPALTAHEGLIVGVMLTITMYGVRYVVRTRIMQS